MHPSKSQRIHQQGYVLGVSLVVMLVFLITCIGFMNFTYTDSMETTRKANDLQAFWASESANNLAIRRLELQPGYRTSPTNLVGSIGEINYTTEVQKSFHHYTIRTTSSRGSWRRVVEFETETTPIAWHPAFETYAAMVENGSITIAATATITGGYQDAHSGGSSSGPALDTSYYDNLLSKAAASGASASGPAITLSSTPLFIQGDQTIQTVSGSGTLIASDDIEISSNATIGPNVTLIAGDRIDIQSGTSFGTNTTLYAGNLLAAMDHCTFDGASSLISAIDISIADHCNVYGTLYAAQSIIVSSNTTIQGSVFADTAVSLGAYSTITHDPSQFSAIVPPILEGNAEHASTRHQWSEPPIVPSAGTGGEEDDD